MFAPHFLPLARLLEKRFGTAMKSGNVRIMSCLAHGLSVRGERQFWYFVRLKQLRNEMHLEEIKCLLISPE